METLQSQNSGNPASVSQAAALAALRGPTDFLDGWRAEYRRRRDLLACRLDGAHGLSCPSPAGDFYSFISCGAQIGKRTPGGSVIRTDDDFVMYLLNDYGVAAVQGAAYGLSPAFRLSFTPATEIVEEACSRILPACEVLQ